MSMRPRSILRVGHGPTALVAPPVGARRSLAFAFALTLALAPIAIEAADATNLFGLPRLRTIELRLPATNWAAMEPTSGRFGGGPRGFRPPPDRDRDRDLDRNANPEPQVRRHPVPFTDRGPAGPVGPRAADRPADAPRPPGPEPAKAEFPWSTCTFEGDGIVLTNVAIRFKGNSSFGMSRGGPKRPFKLDFNRGAKGRHWLGTTELLLNNNATFRHDLPGQLDVTNLLRYVAVNAWFANYDSFLGNGHNYYLFLPPPPGRATFIPWDLNEAFGGHPPGGARSRQAEFSVLRPQANPNRLIERVFADPEWAAEYRRILQNLLEGPCRPERLRADVARVVETIREAVAEESSAARARFERIALGRSGTVVADGSEPDRGRPTGPGGNLQRLEDIALVDWIDRRAERVRAELNGTRTGTTPDLGRRPGPFGAGPGPEVGPGFGPGPGAGFGPRRDEEPSRRPDR